MREVPVQSSISFYILSIPHAESITMQMPNLFLFLLSWSMHGKWMLWKLQERTGTLKCIYVPPSRHSSSPPPLAPCSASSLNFFSSVIHSSRVLFLLFCFTFSCLRLRRRSEGHTPLYYATEKFLVRTKSPQQQCKRKQKVLKIGNNRAKEHKKLCRFVHAT